MYQLVFYVPPSHCEAVKEALFEKGAGRYRGYDRCSFETEGAGQFRPRPGSVPFTGSVGKTEHLREVRVEMLCPPEVASAVVAELLRVHPYEEPAYALIEISTAADLGSRRTSRRAD